MLNRVQKVIVGGCGGRTSGTIGQSWKQKASNGRDEKFGNEKNKLVLQPLGLIVMEFLEKNFNDLFDYNYTKQMEDDLDKISQGNKVWHELCKDCNEQISIFIWLIL